MSRLDQTEGFDPIDDAIRQLRAAGCTANIVPLAVGGVASGWLVIGRKGGVRLMARGPTRLEAWANALARARELGMLEG